MSSQQTLITTHSVETPSGRISYASAGSGPVALFVHDVVLNKHLWRHQLAGLSDIRRCVAVDLLAHGDTEITETIPGAKPPVELQGARIFFPEERAGEFNRLVRDHLLAT
jgi:pimeloyl-ACP methyl ester carboxylesterase